jgi:hypothetical protein
VTYHFSDCQAGAAAGCVAGNNANPGTQAAPKRDLTGINLNALAAGSQLLFARGGAWAMSAVSIENPNTSASTPLTFADYGSGALPLLRYASGVGFTLGGIWSNQTNDGGYVFRNLRMQGALGTDRAFWLVQNLRDVTIDGVHIDGWRIGIGSNTGAPYGVTNISVRNSRITNNIEMGWLGHVRSGLRIEGNHFEGNNPSGNGTWHAVYNGGGDNGVFRNNRFVRNSVNASTGLCSSGSLTLHGLHNNTLVEGNVFEQTAAAPSCWQVSINAGYAEAEAFRGLVIRGNRLVNGGNGGIVVSSAPGVVIEDNVIWNTQTTAQRGVAVGRSDYDSGDAVDSGAIVRRNTACYPTPHTNSAAVSVSSSGSSVADNAMLTGSSASSGVCAL